MLMFLYLQEDPQKFKQSLEQHNRNIEIGLNQLEKLEKTPTTGYYIDRSTLPAGVNSLADVFLRGNNLSIFTEKNSTWK